MPLLDDSTKNVELYGGKGTPLPEIRSSSSAATERLAEATSQIVRAAIVKPPKSLLSGLGADRRRRQISRTDLSEELRLRIAI